MPGEPALRTSTKAGGTMTVGAIVVSLLGSFFPDVLASMSPEAILLWGGLITGAIGWVTARFSKTAQSPGIL